MAGRYRPGMPSSAGTQIRRLLAGQGRRLVATLAYDTRLEALPRGVRTVNRDEQRLLFLVEEYEVLLKVSADAASGLLGLSGQILADGLPATRADVALVGPLQQGRPIRQAAPQAVDDDGGFRLPGLPLGTYRLDVAVGADSIVVPDVDLRDGLPTGLPAECPAS